MKYFSHYTEGATSLLLAEMGAFFAFGNDQFQEKRKENVNYVNCGFGLVCPKENVKTLTKRLNEIIKDAVHMDVQENGAMEIIKREYFNYECQITMNTDEATKALSYHIELYPELFSDQVLTEVYKECFDIAVSKDLF